MLMMKDQQISSPFQYPAGNSQGENIILTSCGPIPEINCHIYEAQ
jgi:hypothetical protein